MAVLLTSAQMKAIEQDAISAGLATGQDLMERAGQGVVEAMFAHWPEWQDVSQHAVVLCGPGNNGGDGFVVARLLEQLGWHVEVFLLGEAEKLPPDARANYQRWAKKGPTLPLSAKAVDPKKHKGAIYIDALFGTGLTRPLEGAAFDVQRRLFGLKGPLVARKALVAIDCPSGLCLDSGRAVQKAAGAAGLYVPVADLTVTFQAPKRGHYIADGPVQCGVLAVQDIGLAQEVADAAEGRSALALDPTLARDFARLVEAPVAGGSDYASASGAPTLRKRTDLHKYNHGHALVLAGPPGKGGAARLAARAALRVGAGLVSVGCPLRATYEHSAQLTAVMVQPLDGPPGLAEILEDKRINALCLGPGLGLGMQTHDFVMAALKSGVRLVLDADALSRFQAKPEVLLDALHGEVVLTPHDGEFARLFPDIAKRLAAVPSTGPAYSRLDAVREAAQRAGCVILLKGPDTVIAHPAGPCAVHAAHYDRSAPWLATAGSGDVLAGLITGLLARGFAPMAAAETAAWLHAEAALRFGPGLISEDIPEVLPSVLRDVLG